MKNLIAALLVLPLVSCVTSGDLAQFEARTAEILADQERTSEEKLAAIGDEADALAETVEERTRNVLRVPLSSGNPLADLLVWGIGLATGTGVGVNRVRNAARAKRGEPTGTTKAT